MDRFFKYSGKLNLVPGAFSPIIFILIVDMVYILSLCLVFEVFHFSKFYGIILGFIFAVYWIG